MGHDNVGWSIDSDKYNMSKLVRSLGYDITDNVILADIILSVWWNQLLSLKFRIFKFIFRNKIIITTFTNDISHQINDLYKIKNIANFFIYSNSKQKKILLNYNFDKSKIFYNPYFVDKKIFFNRKESKKNICKKLNINYELIKKKFLIGNFQRDSLANNLNLPKWQKNPDLLIKILYQLKKQNNNFVFIIAGPRRHYIINECIKYKIPYLFIGSAIYLENNTDDIFTNNLSNKKMSLLYKLIDLYIIPSLSEGGPKSIPECSLSKTSIISTDVGMARDLLCTLSIFENVDCALRRIKNIMNDKLFRKNLILQNYHLTNNVYDLNMFKIRTNRIIESCLN